MVGVDDVCSEGENDQDMISDASSAYTCHCVVTNAHDEVNARQDEKEIVAGYEKLLLIEEDSSINYIDVPKDKEQVKRVAYDDCRRSPLDLEASGRSSTSVSPVRPRNRTWNENSLQQRFASISCGLCCWSAFIIATMLFFWPIYLTALVIGMYAPIRICYHAAARSFDNFRQMLSSRRKILLEEKQSTCKIDLNQNDGVEIVAAE